jgi:hypothetical protein
LCSDGGVTRRSHWGQLLDSWNYLQCGGIAFAHVAQKIKRSDKHLKLVNVVRSAVERDTRTRIAADDPGQARSVSTYWLSQRVLPAIGVPAAAIAVEE